VNFPLLWALHVNSGAHKLALSVLPLRCCKLAPLKHTAVDRTMHKPACCCPFLPAPPSSSPHHHLPTAPRPVVALLLAGTGQPIEAPAAAIQAVIRGVTMNSDHRRRGVGVSSIAVTRAALSLAPHARTTSTRRRTTMILIGDESPSS
jgi:hypothetical protein